MNLDDPSTYGIEVNCIGVSGLTEIDGAENADDTVCVAGRNDYMTEYVGEMTFEEIMAGVSNGDTLDERKEFYIQDVLLKEPGHYGPFEQPQFHFAIKGISRVTMAQITRHRIGITFDVQSWRYTSPDIDVIYGILTGDEPIERLEEYVVVPRLVRAMDEELDPIDYVDAFLWNQLDSFLDYAELYEEAVSAGFPEKRAKEDARYHIPKSARVNMVTSMTLRTLMHIADMRAAADAQWEVRAMTEELLNEAEQHAPISLGYYRDEMANRRNRLAP